MGFDVGNTSMYRVWKICDKGEIFSGGQFCLFIYFIHPLRIVLSWWNICVLCSDSVGVLPWIASIESVHPCSERLVSNAYLECNISRPCVGWMPAWLFLISQTFLCFFLFLIFFLVLVLFFCFQLFSLFEKNENLPFFIFIFLPFVFSVSFFIFRRFESRTTPAIRLRSRLRPYTCSRGKLRTRRSWKKWVQSHKWMDACKNVLQPKILVSLRFFLRETTEMNRSSWFWAQIPQRFPSSRRQPRERRCKAK